MAKEHADESHWITVSDLMAGLMLLFMLITISFLAITKESSSQIKSITQEYAEAKKSLYQDLKSRFSDSLSSWSAEIDTSNLIVRFKSPDVLFKAGSATLELRFQDILKDFFPRYLHLLISEKYHDLIDEIRIEGHTSSEWKTITDEETAYFNNMKLSQDRTREVLEYAFSTIASVGSKMWAQSKVTANGMSSSRLEYLNGLEDKDKSRRVEFRIRLKTKGLEDIDNLVW